MATAAASSRPVALDPPSRSTPAVAACGRLPSSWRHFKQQPARQRQTLCRSSGSSAGTAVTPAPAAASEPVGDVWAQFAAAVSGEWDGITASFDAEGAPIPLPEYYVPQAYRDWQVELFDWQSQSSMLADETGLTAKNRRMMPTVGCEADAIAFTQEAAQLFSLGGRDNKQGGSGPTTVAPDGSYIAGPLDVSAPDCLKAAFETCLALPAAEAGEGQQQQQRMRLRVVHNLRRAGAEGAWQLEDVELHSERFDSPYRGKVELTGCGGGMVAFASNPRLAADALAGSWVVASGLRYHVDPSSTQCSCAAAERGERWAAEGLPQGLLLHPLRVWTACSTGGQGGGDMCLAAGVLLNEAGSKMAVATRRMEGGRLAGMELLTLERV